MAEKKTEPKPRTPRARYEERPIKQRTAAATRRAEDRLEPSDAKFQLKSTPESPTADAGREEK